MRKSRLVGASLSVAFAAALVVPVTSNIAIADDVVSAPVQAPVAVPTLTPAQLKAQRKAERLRQRHLRAVSLRKRLVAYAKTKLHGRGQYVAGASSEWQFDCSGFTKQIYKKIAHIYLPHYSGAQLTMHRGVRIYNKKNLLPGDLLLWGSNGSQHASMYIGHGMMIGANNPYRDVVIEPINTSYWAPRYAGARRLIIG